MTSKAHQNLDLISVVIPTYNRHSILSRSIRYWSLNPTIVVYILDGSTTHLPKSVVNELPRNINYYHWPVSLIERLSRVAELIATPYTVMISDDEFHVTSSLSLCTSYLEHNIDHVAAIGRAVTFQLEYNGIYSSLIYSPSSSNSLPHSDRAHRLLDYFSSYAPNTIYAVVRTSCWKLAVNTIASRQIPVLGHIELEFEASIVSLGKSVVLPCLMWFRSFENPSVDSPDISLPLHSGIHFVDWWSGPGYTEQRNQLLDHMVACLSTSNDYSLRSDLLDAFDSYTSSTLARRNARSDLLNPYTIIRFLPKRLRSSLRSLFTKSRCNLPFSSLSPLSSTLNRLESDNVLVDWKEVAQIQELILSPPQIVTT